MWPLIAPAVLVAAGGCLASKGDIRLLQDQLLSMQSTQARSDSLRRMQTDSALQLLARAGDSLRALSSRFGSYQAKTAGDLYNVNRQLITVQELLGQTQRRLQEFRATVEERNEAAAAAAATAPQPSTARDTTRAAAPAVSAPAAGPGPAQLFQIGMDQMRRQSFAAARSAFGDLLTRFPTFDDAPAAQLYIGEAYDFERNRTAADSVYQLVINKYPQSPRAATALFKYAKSQLDQGHKQQARLALNRLIRDFPNSDEFSLANDLLKTIK